MRYKKAMAGPIASIVISLLIVVAIVSGGYLWIGPKLKNMSLEQTNIKDTITCDSTTTPDLDPNAYDGYAGTALTETTNLQRKVGDTAWSTFTQGTAITGLEIGEKYELIFGIDTSDFTDNAYGPHFITDPIECVENVDFADIPLYNDEEEASLTAVFYNDDSNAAAETYTTGQTQNIYLKWTAGSKEVFGNPYVGDTPNVVCLSLNSSEWDVPVKVSVEEGYKYDVSTGKVVASSIGSIELKRVSTPVRHSAVASMIAYCYEAPVVGEDGLKIKATLNADDSNAPGTDMTASLYAGNFFYNADSFEIMSGIENEEGTAVGTDAADTLTMDFTP